MHNLRIRHSNSSLHDLLQTELRGKQVIAVSNREPYIHRRNGDQLECMQPASGLTVALDPIMRASEGTWIAHGSGDGDRIAVDAMDHVAVPPENPRYTLRRVWLDQETEQRYYYGLANEGLWPLCHIAFHRPVFRLSDWEAYRKANAIFAEAVLQEAQGRPALVFIQDYHLGLLPAMLKKKNPNLTVAQFWHIPWPNREVFRAFPWKEELLAGLLGNDLLGFHLQYHCANFLDTVDRGLEAMVDSEHCEVFRRGHRTQVRPFPISIDFERHTERAASPEVERLAAPWRAELGDCSHLGIGIDRADYTKGIPDRLWAVDRLLATRPQYRRKLVFLQVAVPSRTRIDGYQALSKEIESIAEQINTRWSVGSWRPIHLCRRHLPQEELMALHRLARFCVVSSLHDGMNLVAKEFAASRTDEDGVLVLSNFTGAARELTSAVLVNPFSADQIADAVHRALTMTPQERKVRMQGLRKAVSDHNIYDWGASIIRSLSDSGRLSGWQFEEERIGMVSGI